MRLSHVYFSLPDPLASRCLFGFLIQLGAHLTRNSNTSAFDGMLELPMANLGFDAIPATRFDESDDLADFHLLTTHARTDQSTHKNSFDAKIACANCSHAFSRSDGRAVPASRRNSALAR